MASATLMATAHARRARAAPRLGRTFAAVVAAWGAMVVATVVKYSSHHLVLELWWTRDSSIGLAIQAGFLSTGPMKYARHGFVDTGGREFTI